MLIKELFKIEPKKPLIMEGGNSRALDSDGNLMVWKGEPAYAQKMDLKKHGRANVRDAFVEMFEKLNALYEREHGEPIWNDFSIITSGHAFNGSSESFFDPDVDDAKYTKFKPMVGDVDLSVPKDTMNNIWALLKSLEGKKLTDKITYVGNNKVSASAIGEQINAVFDYTDDKGSVLGQVDFEASEFEDDKPSEWAKFSHSSDWADIEAGIKGVMHKFLMQAIASSMSMIKGSQLLTPASPATSVAELDALATDLKQILPQFEELDKFFTDNKGTTDKEVKETMKAKKPEYMELKKKKAALEKEIKQKTPKIPKGAEGQDVAELAFSVLYGLRKRGVRQLDKDGNPVMVGNRQAVKNLSPAETGHINKPAEMFQAMFGKEPSPEEVKALRSYVGLLALVDKYKDIEDIPALRDEFVRRLWGIRISELPSLNSPDDLNKYKAAQALERDSWELDKGIKVAAIDKFNEMFPEAKLDEKTLQKLLYIYYGEDGEAYQRLRSAGADSDEIKGGD